MPSLSQLYDPTFGNAELQPERSQGWEFGLEKHFLGERVFLETTYFLNKFRDLIDGKVTSQGGVSVLTARDWDFLAAPQKSHILFLCPAKIQTASPLPKFPVAVSNGIATATPTWQ